MRTLAVVVTYYPEKELLQRNVSSYMDIVEKVLIWENTPEADAMSRRYIQNGKIEYVGNRKNDGIAKALNYAWKYAKANGYDVLLTMDQDSVLENFDAYYNKAKQILSYERCIVGPIVNEKPEDFDCEVVKMPYIITSGMLIPIGVLDILGGYNETFFVDAIDLDICIRSIEHGIPVYKLVYGQMVQQYGNGEDKCIFGKRVHGYNYSLFRYEGIFRNHIILYRLHRDNVELKNKIKHYYKSYLKGIILVEKNKLSKLKAIAKGTYKGLTYKI